VYGKVSSLAVTVYNFSELTGSFQFLKWWPSWIVKNLRF